jgi:hypothetical protein
MTPYNLKHAESILSQYEELRSWVENRMISMGMQFDNAYVRDISFENGKIEAHVEYYGESDHIALDWAELADETNETYNTNEAERKRLREAQQAEAARVQALREVEYFENQLAQARAKAGLQEDNK